MTPASLDTVRGWHAIPCRSIQSRQCRLQFADKTTGMNAGKEPDRDWFAEFRRRRMFRAMVAYFIGAWLLLQIANVTFPPLGLPDWMQRALIIALAIGIVPAFALAWIYDLTAHGVVRTSESISGDTSAPKHFEAQMPARTNADTSATETDIAQRRTRRCRWSSWCGADAQHRTVVRRRQFCDVVGYVHCHSAVRRFESGQGSGLVLRWTGRGNHRCLVLRAASARGLAYGLVPLPRRQRRSARNRQATARRRDP